MILIISSYKDDHAQIIMQSLQQLGADVRLLDLSEFPRHLRLCIDYSTTGGFEGSRLEDNGDALLLSECRVVWWRRPEPFEFDSELDSQESISFTYNECYSAMSGLWLNLDTFWVNHPTKDDEAARKPYQLKVAHEVGFEIPRTLITSDPQAARDFVESVAPDRTVYKAFAATEETWRETRVLKDKEMELLDAVRYAPVIFQEYIPPQLDLRVTVIGDEIFACAIYSADTLYEVDYRMELNKSRVEPYTLPDDVIRCIQRFMRKLALVYGAIDMRLTPDGRFVFIEINPSGQWLFMESRTGLPMTKSFSKLLLSHDS